MMPPWIVTCSCGALVRASETLEEATTLVESQTRVVTMPLTFPLRRSREWRKRWLPATIRWSSPTEAEGGDGTPGQEGLRGWGVRVWGVAGLDALCAGRPPVLVAGQHPAGRAGGLPGGHPPGFPPVARVICPDHAVPDPAQHRRPLHLRAGAGRVLARARPALRSQQLRPGRPLLFRFPDGLSAGGDVSAPRRHEGLAAVLPAGDGHFRGGWAVGGLWV